MNDPYIPVREIPKAVARMTGNSTKPSRSVVYRWLKNGNRGVKLRRCWIGSIQHTRESWLRDFIDATESSSADPTPLPRPTASRRVQRDRDNRNVATQRQLHALGL